MIIDWTEQLEQIRGKSGQIRLFFSERTKHCFLFSVYAIHTANCGLHRSTILQPIYIDIVFSIIQCLSFT